MKTVERGSKYAMHLLTRQMRTEKELYDKLVSKDYEPDVAREVVDKMIDFGFVNDRTFTELFIESRKHKYGPVRLKMDLKRKGVNSYIIEDVFAEIEEDDSKEDLLSMAEKKYNSYKEDDSNRYNKTIGFLQRRGFTYGQIKDALDELEIKRY